MEYIDLVGVVCLHVSCYSASSLVEPYLASPDSHGLILILGGWVLACYIRGVTKMDRLAASPLGSVADSLPWELSLLLKHRFTCPLVLGQGRDIDGGLNPS